MNSVTANGHREAKTSELIVWAAVALLGGFLVPGLGIVIGLVLAYTRLRHMRPVLRWSIVAIGTALLVVQLVGLSAGAGDSDVSPISVVN